MLQWIEGVVCPSILKSVFTKSIFFIFGDCPVKPNCATTRPFSKRFGPITRPSYIRLNNYVGIKRWITFTGLCHLVRNSNCVSVPAEGSSCWIRPVGRAETSWRGSGTSGRGSTPALPPPTIPEGHPNLISASMRWLYASDVLALRALFICDTFSRLPLRSRCYWRWNVRIPLQNIR